MHCKVHLGKKQIREKTCFEQHASRVDSLGSKMIFMFSGCHVFRPQKEAKTMKKTILTAHLRIGPPKLLKGPFRSKKWAHRGPLRVLEGAEKDQSQLASLVFLERPHSFVQHFLCSDLVFSQDGNAHRHRVRHSIH